MANRVFYYFYAPTWDCPPGGPIKLGNVITSVKKPERPLYTAPLPAESEVFSSEKTAVESSLEKLRTGKFSILTKFLSVLGFGIDVGAEWEKRYVLPLCILTAPLTVADWQSDETRYLFDRIVTTQFVPKPEYFQRCIESESVRRYLQISRFRKPVYVITGIKVVTGAKARSIKSRSRGGTLAAEIDGTVWSGGAVPISGGPGMEGKVADTSTTQWDGSSDFVFAFRVRKIVVGKATGTVLKEVDYNVGAMLGNEDANESTGPRLSILSAEDPRAEDEGFDAEELMDDGTVVFCAIPRPEASDDMDMEES